MDRRINTQTIRQTCTERMERITYTQTVRQNIHMIRIDEPSHIHTQTHSWALTLKLIPYLVKKIMFHSTIVSICYFNEELVVSELLMKK